MKKTIKNTLIFISISGLIISCQTSNQDKPIENQEKPVNTINLIQEKYDRYDLSIYEKIELTEKLALMEQVKDFYPQYSENNNWPSEYVEYFHFIDIDSDGDKDLIYDGWSGGEPMMVQISLKINEDFQIQFTDYINLTNIQFKKGVLTELTIHDSGCCMAIMEHYIKFECLTKKDSIDYWITEHIEYHNETPKPNKYFEKPIEFEVINSPYTLRVTPSIDTSRYYYPDDSKGNVVQTFSKGDKGFAYAEKSDVTGRVWWYVIMNAKENTQGKIRNRDDYEPKLKGWMSNRYLNKI